MLSRQGALNKQIDISKMISFHNVIMSECMTTPYQIKIYYRMRNQDCDIM